jgi:hypothetical protein
LRLNAAQPAVFPHVAQQPTALSRGTAFKNFAGSQITFPGTLAHELEIWT